jgi:hypothetical protein
MTMQESRSLQVKRGSAADHTGSCRPVEGAGLSGRSNWGPRAGGPRQPVLIEKTPVDKEAVVDSISFMSVLSLAMTAFGLGFAIGVAFRERP